MSLNLTDLVEGAALSILQHDYLVQSVLRLGTGNALSANYRLQNGSHSLWLCAREREELTLVTAKEVAGFNQLPDQEYINWQGQEFQLVARATSRAIAPSEQGYNRFVNLSYADYRRGQEWLLFTQVGTNLVSLQGREIDPAALTIYGKPGR